MGPVGRAIKTDATDGPMIGLYANRHNSDCGIFANARMDGVWISGWFLGLPTEEENKRALSHDIASLSNL